MDRWLAARAWADFRSQWRTSLAFHLLMQLLGVAIFTPIVSWIGRRIVLASGEPVISNFDIAAFALSPTGIAFVLVIAALSVSLLLAEFAGQSWLAGHAIARHRVTVWSTVAFVLRLAAESDPALGARVLAPAASGTALSVCGGRHLVHAARRARHQLLPRGASARVAAHAAHRRRPGHRLPVFRASGRSRAGSAPFPILAVRARTTPAPGTETQQ